MKMEMCGKSCHDRWRIEACDATNTRSNICNYTELIELGYENESGRWGVAVSRQMLGQGWWHPSNNPPPFITPAVSDQLIYESSSVRVSHGVDFCTLNWFMSTMYIWRSKTLPVTLAEGHLPPKARCCATRKLTSKMKWLNLNLLGIYDDHRVIWKGILFNLDFVCFQARPWFWSENEG